MSAGAGIETAELVGAPHDGAQLKVRRDHAEALVWYRGGAVYEAAPDGTLSESYLGLAYPTRHRYARTVRRTAGGATVFRYHGRIKGLFPAE